MQVSGSITYLSSPIVMALTGQFSAHAPQEMHSSEILYAMVCDPPYLVIIFYHKKIILYILFQNFFYFISNFIFLNVNPPVACFGAGKVYKSIVALQVLEFCLFLFGKTDVIGGGLRALERNLIEGVFLI